MDIRTRTANMIVRRYGIPKEVTMSMFDDEILTDHQAKKILIRDEFLNSSTKLRVTELKLSLAERFCVSLSTVEKYIQGT